MLGLSYFAKSMPATAYVLFLMSHNLDLLQVNLVNAVYMTTLLFAEVPTGLIADLWGRKQSFMLANFLAGAGLLLYFNAHSLIFFVAAEIIIAIGYTCESGAFLAWVIDTAKQTSGYEIDSRIYHWRQWTKNIAGGVGILTGALLAKHSLATPYLVSGSALIAVGLLSGWLIQESRPARLKATTKKMQHLKKLIVLGWQKSRTNPAIRFSLVFGFVLAVGVQALNMQWQPFFKERLGDQLTMGWLFTGALLAISLGNFLANKLLKRLKGQTRTTLVVAMMLTGLAVMGIAKSTWLLMVIAFFLSHEMSRGMIDPIMDRYIHDSIQSAQRASLASISSLGAYLGAIVGLVLSGYLAKQLSIPQTWWLAGIFLVLAALVLFVTHRQKKLLPN